MGGGVIIGVLWGVLVSGVVLAAVSLSTPLPPRPDAIPVVMDAGTDDMAAPNAADRGDTPGASADTEATTPDRDLPERPAAGDTTVAAPSDPVFESAPAPEISIATPPGAPGQPAPEDANAPAPVTRPAGTTTTANTPPQPNLPAAVAMAPPAAQTDPAPAPLATATPPEEGPAAAALPPVPAAIAAGDDRDGAAASLPGTDATPRLPQVALAAPETAPATPPAADPAPADGADPTPEVTAPRLPQISAEQDDTADTTGASNDPAPVTPAAPRLPQIAVAAPDAGDASDTMPADTAPAGAQAADTDSADTSGTPPNALRDNAVAFEAAPDAPLLSIVLIDDPDTRLTLETLTSFTFPVTFAIDPTRPDAAARAEAFRAAGFEVVIYADILPDAATPADFEVAFEAAQITLPGAVAVMDTPDSRIQADRPVLDATVAALGQTGHGLIAFPRGLNAAEQSALRADVPAGTIFRLLDDEDQRATVITRFLTRAGFAAGTDGAVIVAGRARPDTVTALFSWAVGSRSAAVTLAPLSALLLRSVEE